MALQGISLYLKVIAGYLVGRRQVMKMMESLGEIFHFLIFKTWFGEWVVGGLI